MLQTMKQDYCQAIINSARIRVSVMMPRNGIRNGAVGTNENSSPFRDVKATHSKTETMIPCVALTASMNIEFLLPSSINSNR